MTDFRISEAGSVQFPMDRHVVGIGWTPLTERSLLQPRRLLGTAIERPAAAGSGSAHDAEEGLLLDIGHRHPGRRSGRSAVRLPGLRDRARNAAPPRSQPRQTLQGIDDGPPARLEKSRCNEMTGSPSSTSSGHDLDLNGPIRDSLPKVHL